MGFFLDVLFRAIAGDEHEAPPVVPGDDVFARWTNQQVRGDERLRTTLEIFRAGVAPDREHEIRLARTRWLEEHRAIASFTCGVAAEDGDPADVPEPDPWGERSVRTVPVIVAVLPEEFAFLREGGDAAGTEPLAEVGRFPRAAFVSAHLEDGRGNRVAAPLPDTFEPAAPCRLVVTWRGADGAEDHDAFAFLSLSVAEEAAGRFRRFASVS